MSHLTPSPHIQGEFVVNDTGHRAANLAAALGAGRYHGLTHLTPARARKYAMLFDCGFEAVTVDGKWMFRRGASKALTLNKAVMCVEVMTTPLVVPVEGVA